MKKSTRIALAIALFASAASICMADPTNPFPVPVPQIAVADPTNPWPVPVPQMAVADPTNPFPVPVPQAHLEP